MLYALVVQIYFGFY